jgi:hypothetical protein
LLATVVVGGCGGSPPGKPAAPARTQARAPASTANCAYWRVVDRNDRVAVIQAIRSFAGGPVGSASGKRGAVLDDDVAYRVFDSFCTRDLATHFKLYKLYTRAAAFRNR